MDRRRPKWRNKRGSRSHARSHDRQGQAAHDPVDGYFRSLGPGEPGFRNQPGSSGLDPVATWAECGRAAGLLIRRILTALAGIAGPRQGDAPDRPGHV